MLGAGGKSGYGFENLTKIWAYLCSNPGLVKVWVLYYPRGDIVEKGGAHIIRLC